MALVKCKECGNEVSDSAKTCPKCGIEKPVKKRMSMTFKLILILLAAGVLLPVVSVMTGNPPSGGGQTQQTKEKSLTAEEKMKINALQLMRGLKASLKDPESARFGHITIDAKGSLLCGEVNAKNSLGGYAGNNNFAFSIGAGYIDGDTAYQLCYGAKAPFPQTIDLTKWF
jgi:predicted nucleic acid-binding Zn ribbon protein